MLKYILYNIASRVKTLNLIFNKFKTIFVGNKLSLSMNIRATYLLFILSILLLFTSCIQQKHIVYFNEYLNDSISLVKNEYKIQKEDILHISTKSLTNNEIDYLINSGEIRTGSFYSEANLAITGYKVNNSGNIYLPLVGEIHAEGLTLNEIEDSINIALQKYMKNTFVSVRLVNFKVTVLGEVRFPGTFNFYNSEVSIFEALSEAGDITDYGNKTQVTLIRSNMEKKESYEIDLTNSDVLSANIYYLKPNDIIFVSPVKGKFFRENVGLYSFILSSLTTIILIFDYIQQ